MAKSLKHLLAVSIAALAFLAPNLASAADNSSIPVASGNETFANKDISGVKFPKHILYNSSGVEVGTAGAPLFMQGTIAISNTTFASTQSGAWNITNITGTISLPTGAATAANQATANTSLAAIQASAAAGTQTNGSATPASSIALGASGSGATGGNQQPLVTCDLHAFFDSTTALTTLVAGVASRKTYVCGYLISTGATATNIGLTSGTGTNCVTTSVAMTPVFKLLANDSRGAMSAFWTGLITLAAADNLCQSASAANDHQVEVWYAIR